MSQHELARLLVKIAGLVFIVYAFIGLPQNIVYVVSWLSFETRAGVLSFGQSLAMPQFWGMSFAPFVFYLVAGVALFRWSVKIVDGVVVGRDASEITSSAHCRGLEEMAVAVLGVYLLVEGLADATRVAGGVLGSLIQNHRPFALTFWPTGFGAVLSAALRVIIGLLLMLRSRGVVALCRLIRGRRPLDVPSEGT